jgi:glycosyltransferase
MTGRHVVEVSDRREVGGRMRVLFTALGGRPHLYPLVPLAWALRTGGHEVRFASSPNLADDAVHSGLPAVRVGGSPTLTAAEREDLVATVFGQDPWPPGYAGNVKLLDAEQSTLLRRLGRYMVALSDAIVDELVAFALDWRPDLVVYEASTFAGSVAAAAAGVPAVAHHVGSDSFPRLELNGSEPLPEYVRIFERFNLPVALSPLTSVEPTPPRMRPAEIAPRLDMRYVPYNGPGAMPDWLPEWLRTNEDRPRVCVTWGYTGPRSLGEHAAGPYVHAIAALASLGAILVLVAPDQLDQLGTLPEGARAVSGVPLQLVVGHCDLLVHQGGDGTTLTGACYGVPQLAITRKPDAETPAVRMAACGVGIHLPYQRLRDDPVAHQTIRDAAQALLDDPEYRRAATDLRIEIEGQPSPAEVVAALEKAATQ